jgi:hypothetical protein
MNLSIITSLKVSPKNHTTIMCCNTVHCHDNYYPAVHKYKLNPIQIKSVITEKCNITNTTC